MANMHICYMSIGFLVVVLFRIITDFASSNNQAKRYIQIQIVHNILGQFIAHTLATVTLTKHISFMSIGFLVVALVLIDDEDWFHVFEIIIIYISYAVYTIRPNFSIHYHNMKVIMKEVSQKHISSWLFMISNATCSRKVLQWSNSKLATVNLRYRINDKIHL